MGSGSKGPYGNNGGSQPYADSYHVVGEMMDKDKQDPNIYDARKGYFKNPLASTIENAIDGKRVVMNNVSADGVYTYVLDSDSNVVFAKRFNPNNSASRAPHPTLIGGKDPVVQCAGMIHFRKGRIVWFNNDSGHFRPNEKSLEKVDLAMNNLRAKYPFIFDKAYIGRKSYDK